MISRALARQRWVGSARPVRSTRFIEHYDATFFEGIAPLGA
jgi:hypothetical protein